MKSKNVLITAGIAVIVLTAILFVIVFSMQGARAEQAVPMEEATEEVPAEAVTEEPAAAEVPEKAAEADIAEEQPAELSAEAEEANLVEPAAETVFEGTFEISCFTQSQKKLKESEVVERNWKTAEPSAADITREQAIKTAKQAGKEIFSLEDLEVKTADFQKDMSGQRGSYWAIQFKEDGLLVSIDSLSGNIVGAYSETRRSVKKEEMPEGEVSRIGNEIVNAEESAQGGEYTAATKAIGEKFIAGKISKYYLNAVHGTGHEYPLVSIVIELEDGGVYEIEWARENENAEIKICWLRTHPSREHYRADANWDADLILFGDDPV